MGNKQVGKIFETYDYNQFKILDSNRAVTDARKNMLKKSIQEYGYIRNPIVVNEKMEILDGQGRFSACKELGKPIQFTVVEGAGIKECMVLNQNAKNWSLTDFIKSYANQGNQSYVYFDELLEKYNLGIIPTLYAIENKVSANRGNDAIKNGSIFIDKDTYHQAIETLNIIKGLEPFINRIDGRKEIIKIGIIFALKIGICDTNRLVESIKKRFTMIAPVASMNGFLDDLSKIYNYKQRSSETRVYLKEEYDRRKRG